MSIKRTGGGAFDHNDRHIYFVASGPASLSDAGNNHPYVLVAVNELMNDKAVARVEEWLDAGTRVLLDSGIFNLTNEHMRAHPGMTMDQALALPPHEIDGFDQLFNRYVQLVERFGDRVWGYIELDQGGRQNKIKTRERLEDIGLAPIPVYHPFNDGWDYFDELAESYDRICFGNVVQANPPTRLRLVRTAWERHLKYPDLWIHLLGLTPNQWLVSYPCDSADSSSWLVSVRWSDAYRETSLMKTMRSTKLPHDLRYNQDVKADHPEGRNKAMAMASLQAAFMQRNWRTHFDLLQQHTGWTPYFEC